MKFTRSQPAPGPGGTPVIYQALVDTAIGAAERIARALEEASEPPALAVGYFDCGGGRFQVFAHYNALPKRDTLSALVLTAAEADEVGPLCIEAVDDEDWVTLSQGKRGPVRAGRFYVHGSHDRKGTPHHRFVLEVDAAQAFGTAHHATTRGCLIALDALIKRRRPRSIFDIGTGTGILAIAAANALKRGVLASDNDPLAVAIAAENARRNCAGPMVRVIKADGFAHPLLRHLEADLVLANLLERAHYTLAPQFARHVRPGGVAVLSGLTEDQARAIEARFRAQGFAMEKRIILDGWATLVIARRSTRSRPD